MCELIRESASDPVVQQCAAYAKKHFAGGSSDPAALAWGVFWYVKHCVRFRLDESTMFQVGEANQQDLLIAPAVLVRMKDPSEDCDGFTMLSAALLTVLGMPVLITTVATDLDDPSRWSHVFLCMIVNGRVQPLDTSHGKAPGWMVPRERINRSQLWTLDGKPSDVKIPNFQGLHGYVGSGFGSAPQRGGGYQRAAVLRPPVVMFPRGRGFGGYRGMGQDEFIDDFETGVSNLGTDFENIFTDDTPFPTIATAPADIITSTTGQLSFPYLTGAGVDSTTAASVAPLVQAPAGYTGPTVVKGTAATPAAPNGYQWAQLINSSGNQLAKILTISQGGSAVTLANGNQLLYGAGSGASASTLLNSLSSTTGLSTSMLLIGGIGLVAFLVLKK